MRRATLVADAVSALVDAPLRRLEGAGELFFLAGGKRHAGMLGGAHGARLIEVNSGRPQPATLGEA